MSTSQSTLIRRHAEYLDAHRRWTMTRPSYRIGALLTRPLSFLRGKCGPDDKPLAELGARPKTVFQLPAGRLSVTIELDLLASTTDLGQVALLILRFDVPEEAATRALELSGLYRTPKGESFLYVEPDELGSFSTTVSVPAGARRLSVELRPWRTNSSVFIKDVSIRERPAELIEYQTAQESRPCRIALYGDLDVNIVDGSSIWLASIAKAFARTEKAIVDLYLKRRPIRQTIIAPLLDDPRIAMRCLDGDVMNPVVLAEHLREQDSARRYDLLVVRGYGANALISLFDWSAGRLCPYITDLPPDNAAQQNPDSQRIQRIIRGAKYLLCQTEGIARYYERHDPAARAKTVIVPPMVPDGVPRVRHGFDRPHVNVVYAGKFARLWAIEEMLDAFAQLRASSPAAELHIFGDKFHHDPADPSYADRLKHRFRSDDGVVWYGGVPRDYVLNKLAEMDVAWAWRDPELEESTRELSTKILEYASAALPVVLYGNGTNRKVLGEDYPLFAATADAASDLLERLANDRHILTEASRRISEATTDFGFDAATLRLAELLPE